jgi:hypothetical protein
MLGYVPVTKQGRGAGEVDTPNLHWESKMITHSSNLQAASLQHITTPLLRKMAIIISMLLGRGPQIMPHFDFSNHYFSSFKCANKILKI